MTRHTVDPPGLFSPDDDDEVRRDETVQALLDREERRLLASAPAAEDGIDGWRALVADPHFTRRSTVLSRSSPLHRLDVLKAWQQFPADLYDPRTLGLAVLEVVVSRQEMELEATTEEVVTFVAMLAREAAPDRDAAEHVAVARFVLRELLNDQGAGADFTVPYSDFRDGHRRAQVSFRLLEETFGRHGQAVLRASVPAINLLLVGLDHDLEDQEAARDEMLRRQVATGRWAQAEQNAGDSLKLSLLYAEELRAVLADTERDVRSVDWAGRVPALLDTARGHLAERLRAEGGLMDLLREHRDGLQDPAVRDTCARILRLLERAHLRHTQLLRQVVGTRPAFLAAQAEQRFRPVPRLQVVGLQEDLFAPLLELGAEEAEQVTGLFARLSGGPEVRRLPRLRDWLVSLLALVRERCTSFPQQPVEMLADLEQDLLVYEAEHYARACELVQQALHGPVRLSQLLAQALPECWEVADLLALSVLRAFAPDPEDDEEADSDLDALLRERMVVLDDGTVFDLGGLGGSDLLLVPGMPLVPEPARAAADEDEGVLV